MNNNATRLRQLAEFKGLSIRKLEKKIGASNGLIGNAIMKNRDIQSKWMSIIIEIFPEINAEWLLTGKGKMLKKGESVIQSANGDNNLGNNKVGNNNNIKVSQNAGKQVYKEANCNRYILEIKYLKSENKTLQSQIKEKTEQISKKDKQIQDLLQILKQK